MSRITYGELYSAFRNHDPDLGPRVIDYRPWGKMSIVVWIDSGQAYKVKMVELDRFIVQKVSEADVQKRFGV